MEILFFFSLLSEQQDHKNTIQTRLLFVSDETQIYHVNPVMMILSENSADLCEHLK